MTTNYNKDFCRLSEKNYSTLYKLIFDYYENYTPIDYTTTYIPDNYTLMKQDFLHDVNRILKYIDILNQSKKNPDNWQTKQNLKALKESLNN